MANPVRPGSDKYPTGQRNNIALAFRNNKNRWVRIAAKIKPLIEALPKQKVWADKTPKAAKSDKATAQLQKMNSKAKWFAKNADFTVPTMALEIEHELFETNGQRYEYQVDAALMNQTMRTISSMLIDDLLGGNDFWTTRFFLNDYLESASEDGTVDSIESVVRISEGTPAEGDLGILDAQRQLSTPAYQDRLRLIHGRVFESMEGLAAETRGQLRVTLTEGMARGLGVRDITGMVNRRLQVGMVRAERIARTEINNAYRTAYLDESKEINATALKETNWAIMQVHRSALGPTTRPAHAARHGTIHTEIDQQEWWATGANSINCQCSTLDVLANKNTGEILQQKMIDKMLEQKKKWFPTG